MPVDSKKQFNFQISWKVVCGGVYYAKQGEFTSPGYAAKYGNNLNCDYRIMAKPTDFVTLNFQEPFEMEQSRFYFFLTFSCMFLNSQKKFQCKI